MGGKTKPCNVFICQSCAGSPEFESDKMLEHLQAVHGTSDTTKYMREMIVHMDGEEWYESQYQWTEAGKEDGVRFQQLVRSLRNPKSVYGR